MRKFFKQYWFLLALIFLLFWGSNSHEKLTPLSKITWLRDANLFTVLLLMALPLQFRALWATICRPVAPGLAIVITYVLAPVTATFIAPLLGPEYGPGFLVSAALPCTMASAAVWTRRAGGNDAVALLVTAITNFFCFLVLPNLLVWTIGEGAKHANINTTKLTQQLLWLVVVPIIVGQLLRAIPLVARTADKHKTLLSLFAQMGILFMVFLGAIQTGNRWAAGQSQGTLVSFGSMVLAVMGLHLFLLFTGLLTSRALRLTREDSLAVAFSGSQKTLMIGLQVAESCGFSILPMICYHVLQLFLDTILAERFRSQADGFTTPVKDAPSGKVAKRKNKAGGNRNR